MMRSPSRMRPSLAAMLFGSICNTQRESQRRRATLHACALWPVPRGPNAAPLPPPPLWDRAHFPTEPGWCREHSAHLADVDPEVVLVVRPVAHGEAQLVLAVHSVQVHFLAKGGVPVRLPRAVAAGGASGASK